jgi:hypothetical protein
MPLPNPWQAATGRRTRFRDEKTFTDAETGFTVTLCFEELDEPMVGLAADRLEEYAARYLQRKPDGSLARQLPIPGGGAARLSKLLLNRIAMFQVMQRPGLDTDRWPEGESPAGVIWWYGVAEKHASLWNQVLTWAILLGAPEVDAEGNTLPGTGQATDPNAPGTPPTTGDSAAS